MKKLAIVFIGLFLMAFSFNAQAQLNSSASADATANILIPISIVKNVGMDLSFGNIIPDATTAGTVAIDVNGNPSYTTVAAPAVTGTRRQAQFTVAGEPDVAYTVTLPGDEDVEISIGGLGGGTPMSVNTFVSDVTPTIEGGSVTLNVGATLDVEAAQPAGLYEGSFTVLVNYN